MLKSQFDCSMIVNNADVCILNLISSVCPVNNLEAQEMSDEFVKLEMLLRINDIFVIDGYVFDENYQIFVKKLVKKLVAVDDLSGKRFAADVILNHGDISVLPYYQSPHETTVFSGFDYLIVRPEFIQSVKQTKKIKIIDTVFICMGGADPFKITIKVLEACLQCSFLKKIIVVTGNQYNNRADLMLLISSVRNVTIEHVENASAAQMVSLIDQSQIAISTASSVSLEICCVKSALLCGTVIDNQYSIHSLLIKNGCCKSIGDWKSITVTEISKQLYLMNSVTLAQKIVDAQAVNIDGKSKDRIIKLFNNLAA